MEIPSKLVEEGKDKDLISFLKTHGPITKTARFNLFEIEGEADHCLYFTYNGVPSFEIEREGE